jgi:hypothetical protein
LLLLQRARPGALGRRTPASVMRSAAAARPHGAGNGTGHDDLGQRLGGRAEGAGAGEQVALPAELTRNA